MTQEKVIPISKEDHQALIKDEQIKELKDLVEKLEKEKHELYLTIDNKDQQMASLEQLHAHKLQEAKKQAVVKALDLLMYAVG